MINQINSMNCGKFSIAVKWQQMTKEKRIWTFKQFCSYYAWPTMSGLRWMYAQRKEKDIQDAFLKVGRRVLVDVDKFWEILQQQQIRK